MCRRHGFSLIELLVVVAILSLLVSLLLPALNRARELARTAVCAANQRNIGVAVAVYNSEQNEFMPLRQSSFKTPRPGEVNRLWTQWLEAGRAVESDTNISMNTSADRRFFCPTNKVKGYTYGCTALGTSGAFGGGSQVVDSSSDPPYPQTRWHKFTFRQISDFTRPGETTLLMETKNNWTTDGNVYEMVNQWRTDLHLQASNFLWADGHVTLKPDGWLKPRSEPSPNYSTWAAAKK